MKIHFSKYQGTGNDFVMVDARAWFPGLTPSQIAWFCDRRFGIGADGLILLVKEPQFDFRMVYYNSDGMESSMCGNGGRCIAAFARKLGIVRDKASFIAVDGPHEAVFSPEGLVRLRMKDAGLPVMKEGFSFLDTGSPHVVVFQADVSGMDVKSSGRTVRNHKAFEPDGTNVNYVEHEGENRLFVRTFERGVEDETYSCGTGVTAAALAASQAGILPAGPGTCFIRTPGGNLKVHYQPVHNGFTEVWLEGPAEFVFEGVVELPAP